MGVLGIEWCSTSLSAWLHLLTITDPRTSSVVLCILVHVFHVWRHFKVYYKSDA